MNNLNKGKALLTFTILVLLAVTSCTVNTPTHTSQPTTSPSPTTTGINIGGSIGPTNWPIMPTFQWGAVTGATSYTLELSTDSAFSALVRSKITTTLTVVNWPGPTLLNNTTYYWRVIAMTPTGPSAPILGVFTTVPAS